MWPSLRPTAPRQPPFPELATREPAPRGAGGKSPDDRTGWSVTTYLACTVVAVVVVFLGAGYLAARGAVGDARSDARVTADELASVSAKLLGDSLSLGQAQLAVVAGNPGLATVLASPEGCELSFQLDPFAGSRLDIVDADGRVVCSSSPAASPAGRPPAVSGDGTPADRAARGAVSYDGTAWFAELRRTGGAVSSALHEDPATGQAAVTFALPISGPEGPAGAVAVVAPTGTVGDRLQRVLGGPLQYEFALVDQATGTVLASSEPGVADSPGAAEGEGEPSAVVGGELSGAAAIPGTTWQAMAGIAPDAALGPVRSLVLRWVIVGVAVLVVLLASLAVLDRRIARPLRLLTAAVHGSASHQWRSLERVRGPAEVLRLARSFRSAVQAHELYQGQLSHQALHDPLTGLPNRVLLAERLAHSLAQASRSGSGVGVLFLDLDGFKLVNDSLGHAVGDQVLTATAARLGEILRAGDTLARFGGDEFVIVGEGLTSRAQAEQLAVRALAAVQTPIEVDGTTVRVSASIGIAISTLSSTGADLVSDADNAMYLAKERGRSRHEVFDRSLRERVTTRLTMANELRAVLERDQLHLVYQPQIDLTTQRAIGAEALLRWEHPALGTVPPGEFIPVAEDMGLMVPIGRYVLEEACRQAAAWQRDGLDLVIAVNVSGRQLSEAGLVDHVATVLARTGIEPASLCLELTESILMSDTARATQTLAALHELGVQLSIDDFGTGYSSLAYLHRFPVDELKIDRAFVHDLTERPDQRTLVSAMVAMGSALGLGIVAEGVETVEQAALLRRLGCPTAQGYLFSAPKVAGSIDGILRGGAGVDLRPRTGDAQATGLDLR